MSASLDEMIGNVWKHRMMKTIQQAGLAFESFGESHIVIKRFLDRHVRAKFLIHGTIDSAHSPYTDLFFDQKSVLQYCPGSDHLPPFNAIPVPPTTPFS